ncbi:MAG: VWA domain-containing protein [Phycisphaerae bacterium]
MNDLYIDNVAQLRWLLLALGAAAVTVYGLVMKRRAGRVFAAEPLLGVLAPDVSRARQVFKALLLLLAMVSIVLALIGPRWGTYFEDAHRRGLDLMVCLDVSKSMLAEDAGMSRLERAKDDVRRLLDELDGAAIGLVTFAGKAELACPLTDDYEYYRLALADVGIHSAPMGGTNLGEALATARKAFGPPAGHDRVVFLLTDGEDHGGLAVDEAEKAREAKILVYTIGIGDEKEGALVPIRRDGGQTFLMYDHQQVWSKANPAHLTAIARAGGGEYHPSGQVDAKRRTLEWLYTAKLAPLRQQSEADRQVERHYVRFHWFAALALALLTLEMLIPERRSIRPERATEPDRVGA